MSDQALLVPSSSPQASGYRVLARKYRPADFSTLIGQDVLVRTLSNAISCGRLAQAWLLTGARGVGKTTAARIISRCLNCVGPDGKSGPTAEPCGVCEHCRAIAEDRHVDVIELDAASRTGVDDIREILNGALYRPISARYKIYIVDEVHMLSKSAFNALLKTLEEPPEHVKFIFATTETRKVPVTVVSRCQRFDLRRVTEDRLQEHLKRVTEQEGAVAEDGALYLLAYAADGSVRDGLSLLDQAIAHCGGSVSEQQVRAMLGLADRGATLDLFEHLMHGDLSRALGLFERQYASGADPVTVLGDLLQIAHWLTLLKVAPGAASDPTTSQTDHARGRDLADRLTVAILTRAWQILLKVAAETRSANHPRRVVEMGLVRLGYAVTLPEPSALIAKLKTSSSGGAAKVPPVSAVSCVVAPSPDGKGEGRTADSVPIAAAPSTLDPPPHSFQDLVALFLTHREMTLSDHLRRNVRVVSYAPGRLEFQATENAPRDLVRQLRECLTQWTGTRWSIVIASDQQGEPTVLEKTMHSARAEPLAQAVLSVFPDANIEAVHNKGSEAR